MFENSCFQILFEAGVGSGPLGDIALDDIQVLRGSCLDEYNNGKFQHVLKLRQSM